MIFHYGSRYEEACEPIYFVYSVYIAGNGHGMAVEKHLNARKATASSALNANILREQIAELRLEIDQLRTAIDENIALRMI